MNQPGGHAYPLLHREASPFGMMAQRWRRDNIKKRGCCYGARYLRARRAAVARRSGFARLIVVGRVPVHIAGGLVHASRSRRTKALQRLPRVIRQDRCLLCALCADRLAGVMLLASLASLLALAGSTLAATHKISVGAYANGTQANVFDPATVKAAVGDSLECVHAATSSSTNAADSRSSPASTMPRSVTSTSARRLTRAGLDVRGALLVEAIFRHRHHGWLGRPAARNEHQG